LPEPTTGYWLPATAFVDTGYWLLATPFPTETMTDVRANIDRLVLVRSNVTSIGRLLIIR